MDMSYQLYSLNCHNNIGKKISISPVYRLVKNKKSAMPSDFVPYIQLYPTKKYNNHRKCIASGISLFSSSNEVKKIIKKIPKFKNYFIAEGSIHQNDGISYIDQANPYHLTWWYSVSDPHLKFRVIP